MRCASMLCVTHQFDILQQLLTGFYAQLAVDVFIVVLQGICISPLLVVGST